MVGRMDIFATALTAIVHRGKGQVPIRVPLVHVADHVDPQATGRQRTSAQSREANHQGRIGNWGVSFRAAPVDRFAEQSATFVAALYVLPKPAGIMHALR